MNTSPHESPRLVCRLVRWWAALTEPSATPPNSTASTGHRTNCPACRAYFESQAALENRLRHDSHTQSSAVPTGLEQRIADAVRQAQLPARAPHRRTYPLWAAGLTTAAAVVAVVFAVNRESRPSQTTAEAEPAEVAAVFKAVTALPQQLGSLFASPVPRAAEQDPLSHELDNVKVDARSALSFLAANFLPSHREPASLPQDRNPAARDS